MRITDLVEIINGLAISIIHTEAKQIKKKEMAGESWAVLSHLFSITFFSTPSTI